MWTCAGCGETSEEQFDACWNCGTSKDGVADPSFQARKAAIDEPFSSMIPERVCPKCDHAGAHLSEVRMTAGHFLGTDNLALTRITCVMCGFIELYEKEPEELLEILGLRVG